MGEIADDMINGDLDYVTGEYLGEGGGFPRTRENVYDENHKRKNNLLGRLDAPAVISELGNIERLLIEEGYIITEIVKYEHNYLIKTNSGGMIALYHSLKMNIQGKPDEKLKKIFG